MSTYVPLWCKSNGSFLEGASHPEELVEQAHALGLPALAITDRGGVYGLPRAHVRAKELGIRLLLGAEVEVGDGGGGGDDGGGDDGGGGSDKVVLLAQDRAGWG